jgi:Endonuclease/Exonuclease/phosphatase family
LRLITWNCCAGPLERKLAELEALAPDIAVIPECPQLPALRGSTFWIGANPRRGLGVIAKPPWRVAPATRRQGLPRYVQPLRVSGPESFTLWAVWACHHGADRYVRGMHRAIDSCTRLLKNGPTVMLGDFNSNAIWDHEHPKDRSHSALVGRLQGFGLASSYHAFYGEPQGSETRPTFFEYRHQHRPYHIDYCFLPESWTKRVTAVELGTHADWARASDHMPLIVDMRPAG